MIEGLAIAHFLGLKSVEDQINAARSIADDFGLWDHDVPPSHEIIPLDDVEDFSESPTVELYHPLDGNPCVLCSGGCCYVTEEICGGE